MIPIFQEEKLATLGMFISFALSIFLRCFIGIAYQKMIQETDNMAVTNNKFLKQCKVKFESCFQLNHGMNNVGVFVDKFLGRISIGPVSFSSINHLSGQCMLLAVVCSGIGICRGIMGGSALGEILPFYIVSMLQLYLYFSISSIVDIKGKRRMLKINLVDYLENHLSARMDVTNQDMERLFGDGKATEQARPRREKEIEIPRIKRQSERVERENVSQKASESPVEYQNHAKKNENEWELEELLKEFLSLS